MAKGKKGPRRGEEEDEEAETEPQAKGGKQGKRGKGRKGRGGDDDDDFFPAEDDPRPQGAQGEGPVQAEEDEGPSSHKGRKDKKRGKAALRAGRRKGEEDPDDQWPPRLGEGEDEEAEEDEDEEDAGEEGEGGEGEAEGEAGAQGSSSDRGGKDRKNKGGAGKKKSLSAAAAAAASFALLADEGSGGEDAAEGDEGAQPEGSGTKKATGANGANDVDEEEDVRPRKGQAKKGKGKKGRRGADDDDYWAEFGEESLGQPSASTPEAPSQAAVSEDRKGPGRKGKKGRKGRDAECDDEFGVGSAGSAAPVGLVVGEVLSAQRVPKSDKLKLCLVDCGRGEPLQIVCGGLNVREGLKVIVAPVGAALPCDGRVLQKAVVRGEESFGMICSAVEMGWAMSAEDVVELDEDLLVGSAAPLLRPASHGGKLGAKERQEEEEEEEKEEEEEISFSGRKRGKKKGARGAGVHLLALEGEEDAETSGEVGTELLPGKAQKASEKEAGGGTAGRRKGKSAALDALMREVEEEEEGALVEEGTTAEKVMGRPSEKPRKGKKAGTGSALEALMAEVEEGAGGLESGVGLASGLEKRKKGKKKGAGSALDALMKEVEGGGSEEGGEAGSSVTAEEGDTSDAIGVDAAAAEGQGAQASVAGPEEEVAQAGREGGAGGGKKKGKKGKGPKAAEPDDDIDAILAQLEAPKAPASDGGGKGKKGKKGQISRTAEEEAELDRIMAELEGPPVVPPPAAQSQGPPPSGLPKATEQGEDVRAEAGADGAAQGVPASGEGEGEGEGEGDGDGDGAGGPAESAAAKKKKKKKEKEKLKKEAAKEAAKEEEGAPGEGPKKGEDLKKLPKHVRELQEKLARMKELEERQRREEEARQRAEEEEAARLAELERQKEEAKRRKKEKEKERIAQLKKEGKYLTGKKKEEARRLQALREQLLATAGLSEPSSEASSSAAVEDESEAAGGGGAAGAQKKTKVVYDSRKKRGPRANPGAAAPLPGGMDSRAPGPGSGPGTETQAGDLGGAPLASAVTGPATSEGEGSTGTGPGGRADPGAGEGATLPPLEQAHGAEQAETEVSSALDSGVQAGAPQEASAAEEEEWDAKSWDADDVELPALKRKGAFDDEEEAEEESKQVVKKEATGGPGAGKAKSAAVKTAPKSAKSGQQTPSAAQNAAAKAKQGGVKEEEEESEDDDQDEDGDEDSEGSEEESDSSSEDESDDDERKKREARERREQRRQQALAQRSAADLRSPICCILGHVDTGKTKLLDCIRRTNVQEGEAGGITQQIGATYFPMENIRERTKELKADATLKVPGLLVIDTPGHESFTNLRSRGSGLCDIAVLVVDIMHGLEPQTIESLNLLKMRKTPFVVAMNKVDRIYGWKPIANAPIRTSLKRQNADAVREFETRCKQVIMELNQQGMNAELYYKNQDIRKYLSIVPTSALTGEGVPDLLLLLVQLTQKMMEDKLMYISDIQCTVLEVKVVEGLGTTIDVVLINGVLHEGDQIVVCGLNGPIVTTIRALLTPHPMKELRVKGSFQHHKELKAAIGIKITAQGLEHAVAGTQLYVVGPDDDVEELMEEAMEDVQGVLARVDKSGEGVCVQASTLGSLEALLEFLKSPAVAIPVSGIAIGPIHKKDVMRAGVMLERKRKEFAVILAFDVKVSVEARELAEEMGVRIFTADIIYHLFDQFTAYMQRVKDEKKQEAAEEAVFPVVLKILPNCIFNKKDPIVLGVEVLDGIAKVGTPLCVPNKEFISIGKIASIEKDHKVVDSATKGQAVAMKIVGSNADEVQKSFGRHFDLEDELVSTISRKSIDLLKENYRDDLSRDEWILVVKLKKLFQIQ